MKIQFKKHVQVICTLNIGQVCWVIGYGPKYDGKQLTIKGIEYKQGCESGFIITVTDYNGTTGNLDSGWISLEPSPTLTTP